LYYDGRIHERQAILHIPASSVCLSSLLTQSFTNVTITQLTATSSVSQFIIHNIHHSTLCIQCNSKSVVK